MTYWEELLLEVVTVWMDYAQINVEWCFYKIELKANLTCRIDSHNNSLQIFPNLPVF